MTHAALIDELRRRAWLLEDAETPDHGIGSLLTQAAEALAKCETARLAGLRHVQTACDYHVACRPERAWEPCREAARVLFEGGRA